MKIITGNTGAKHVTSDDDGALYASIIGKDDYIFDMNDNFAHEILDTNTIKINSGDALLNGRHIRIPRGSYDLVTIDNGQTGYNRIDLITIRYESNGQIENAYLHVIKGTQTTGTATAPSYETGNILNGELIRDFPLYEVHLSGINLDTVTALFEAKELSTTHLGYRPNLLINSDFRNPINQRESTSYSTYDKICTIDRWQLSTNQRTDTVALTVNENSIKITASSSLRTHFRQTFEEPLNDETYTFSLNVLSLQNPFVFYAYDGDGANITNKTIDSAGAHFITFKGTPKIISLTCEYVANEIELEWCKLEQGSIATPFVPRPYAEELLMCQRYTRTIKAPNNDIVCPIVERTNRVYRGIVQLDTIRTIPTFSKNGTFYLECKNTDGTVSAIQENEFTKLTVEVHNAYIQFEIDVSGATNYANYEPIFLCSTGMTMILDGEIY